MMFLMAVSGKEKINPGKEMEDMREVCYFYQGTLRKNRTVRAEVGHEDIWGKVLLKENSKCQGPVVRACSLTKSLSFILICTYVFLPDWMYPCLSV